MWTDAGTADGKGSLSEGFATNLVYIVTLGRTVTGRRFREGSAVLYAEEEEEGGVRGTSRVSCFIAFSPTPFCFGHTLTPVMSG